MKKKFKNIIDRNNYFPEKKLEGILRRNPIFFLKNLVEIIQKNIKNDNITVIEDNIVCISLLSSTIKNSKEGKEKNYVQESILRLLNVIDILNKKLKENQGIKEEYLRVCQGEVLNLTEHLKTIVPKEEPKKFLYINPILKFIPSSSSKQCKYLSTHFNISEMNIKDIKFEGDAPCSMGTFSININPGIKYKHKIQDTYRIFPFGCFCPIDPFTLIGADNIILIVSNFSPDTKNVFKLYDSLNNKLTYNIPKPINKNFNNLHIISAYHQCLSS